MLFRSRRFEGDAVDKLVGDVEGVLLLVVREDAAGSVGEEGTRGAREGVLGVEGLQASCIS